MSRIILTLACLVLFPLESFGDEQLPLEYLTIGKVYKRSFDVNSGRLGFSHDSQSLFVGSGYRGWDKWYLYSLAKKSFVEYGKATKEDLGPEIVNTIPAGYDYIQVKRGSLWFRRDGRFYFYDHKSRILFSTSPKLQAVETHRRFPDGHLQSSTRSPSYNGRAIFTESNRSRSTLFYFANDMKPVFMLTLRKIVNDIWDEVISGVSTYKAAFKNDHLFTLVASTGPGDVKPSVHQIRIPPEDDTKYATAFFANQDKWFCVVLKGNKLKPTRITYYETESGKAIGVFEMPKSFSPFGIDKSVGYDPRGELIILTANRSTAILKVVEDQFELFADQTHFPRLTLLHDRAGKYAVSPDGKRIALRVRASAHKDVSRDGLAIIELDDIKRIRSERTEIRESRLTIREQQPAKGSLFDFKQEDIPVALQEGDEPESIVHILEHSADYIGFSPDARWLLTKRKNDDGYLLFDATDQDTIDLSQYALDLEQLKKFTIRSCEFSKDSKRLATISEDHVSLWDLSKRDPILLHAIPATILDENASDEFRWIREFLFLPDRDEARLLMRSATTTWLLSLAGDRITVLDSFVYANGKMSYSVDGNTVYTEVKQGAIRGYDVSNNRFELKSLTKKQKDLRWIPNHYYMAFARPFKHAYFKSGRDYLIVPFQGDSFGKPEEFPFEFDWFEHDSNAGEIKVYDRLLSDQGLSLSIASEDFQDIRCVIIPGDTKGAVSIANDGRHVAITRGDRIWILRVHFEPLNPQSAGAGH